MFVQEIKYIKSVKYKICMLRKSNISNQVVYFDAIAPSEEIPNHLLLLYLTTGTAF